jgi:FHA domain
MTSICPEGHESSTDDYCDQCGRPIAARPVPPTDVLPIVEDADTSTSTSPADRDKRCRVCKCVSPRGAKFCESCGHSLAAAEAVGGEAPDGNEHGDEAGRDRAAWEILVSVDLDWFQRSSTEGVSAPVPSQDRRYPLQESQVRIGRSNGSAGGTDAAIALEDPGVSRNHATLECQEDGSYAVKDVGSTNGTFINDNSNRIGRDEPVPLVNDDEIHLGAWTTIKVRVV